MSYKEKHPKPLAGITVDDDHSKDLDDAFWIDVRENTYLLRIFISNVGAVVHPGSEKKELYVMAERRVVTQYYKNGHKDPMLPFALSEGSQSLLPGVRRKVICYDIELSKNDLSVVSFNFFETDFVSKQKLSYNEVHSFLSGEEVGRVFAQGVDTVLATGHRIATKLLQKRRSAGALVIYDMLETFTTSEEGALVFVPKVKHKGYILIQELMILCNNVITEFSVKENIPILFRTHRVRDTHTTHTDIMREYQLLCMNPDPTNLNIVQTRLLHMLERAMYSAKHGEHWGLSSPFYSHNTSPIRRFPDLVNQVNLVAYLRKVPYIYTYDSLVGIATHVNATIIRVEEERAQSAKEQVFEEINSDKVTEEWLSKLNQNSFYKYLKAIQTNDGAPSEMFINEIITRIDEDRLDVRDFVLLLFGNKYSSQAVIKSKSLTLLSGDKKRISQMFNNYSQWMNLPTPEVVFGPKQDDIFSATVTLKTLEETYIGGPGKGRSKQQAVHQAFYMLMCQVFAIVNPEKEEIEHHIKKEVVPEFKLLPSDGNYITCLQESAVKAKIDVPEYTFEDLTRQKTKPKFSCTASITVKGKYYEATNWSTNKKEAKSFASEALYVVLQKAGF